ncbi:tape measure protein [Pseudovibrio exalbescens]|uniref:tape measure protein n=1 Tax=Pseudovibrio exalbescens TaxID=197461 RepID=UPI000C9BF701|nr:tape measure protein [Pseudovibrio exalbescens]
MRLGITAEFKDRASKKMRRLLAFNTRMEKQLKAQEKLQKGQLKSSEKQVKTTQKLEKATGQTAQATAKVAKAQQKAAQSAKAVARGINDTARQAERSRYAMSRFVGKTGEAVRKAALLSRALGKVKAQANKIRSGGNLIRGGAGKIGRGLALGAGLYAGASGLAGGAAGAVIGPAAQIENYQIQLNALEGSAERGRRALEWVRNFAVTTPLETNDVIESYAKLKAFGIDPTNGSLLALTDTMAMNGGNAEYLQGVIMAVGQSWTKGKLQGEEAMQLLERGIPVWDMLSDATGKSASELMKMASNGELGRDVISKLVELMGQRAVSASEKMSRTWDGMMSNMRQHWFDFRVLIADAGVFDWAKDKLQGFLDTLNQMKADGSLLQLAEEISANIISGLQSLWAFGVEASKVLQEVGSWLPYAADALGGWNNLIGILIAMPVLSALTSIATGLVSLGAGLVTLGGGILAVGWPILAIVAVVAVLAAAAWLIYDNWDVVSKWLVGAWEWMQQAAGALWDYLETAFSWTPLGIIINNWSAVEEWLGQLWQGIKQTADLTWEGLKTLFSWTPLGMIISNWGEISTWFTQFWADLSALVSNWKWPELPALDLPSFDEIRESLTYFFSLDWLPEWEWPEIPLPKLPDIGGMIENMARSAGAAWNKVTSLFGDDDAVTIAARDPASLERANAAAHKLQGTLSAVAATDMGSAMSKLNSLREFAVGLPDLMRDVIASLEARLDNLDFARHGRRMMETIAAGMRSRAHLLVDEMRRVTQTLRDHLPSSPAKLGPLSDIHRLKFGETIAASIKPAPMVNAMRKAAAATMTAATLSTASVSPALAASAPQGITPPSQALQAAGGPSAMGAAAPGGTISVTFSPTITIGSGASLTEDDIVAVLEEQADRMVDLIEQKLAERRRLEF